MKISLFALLFCQALDKMISTTLISDLKCLKLRWRQQLVILD